MKVERNIALILVIYGEEKQPKHKHQEHKTVIKVNSNHERRLAESNRFSIWTNYIDYRRTISSRCVERNKVMRVRHHENKTQTWCWFSRNEHLILLSTFQVDDSRETGYCRNWRDESPYPKGKKRETAGRRSQYSHLEIFGFFPLLSVRKWLEVTGKHPKISRQEYCFHEISRNLRNRSFFCRILRLGLTSIHQSLSAIIYLLFKNSSKLEENRFIVNLLEI